MAILRWAWSTPSRRLVEDTGGGKGVDCLFLPCIGSLLSADLPIDVGDLALQLRCPPFVCAFALLGALT